MSALWQHGGGVAPGTPPANIDMLLQAARAWA
jgi:hypothetical protein